MNRWIPIGNLEKGVIFDKFKCQFYKNGKPIHWTSAKAASNCKLGLVTQLMHTYSKKK